MSRRTEVHEVSRARIVQGLRALHKPYDIYEDCGHRHRGDEPFVVYVHPLGYMCSQGVVESICTHCCTDGDGQTKTCVREHKHLADYALCPTLAIVEGRDGPWVP